jgi:MFS family permease
MAEHNDSPRISDPKAWADRPGVRRIIIGALALACIGAAGAGFVPAWRKDHPHFEIEGFPVFFAIYGFLAFSFIVLAGQHLRKLVMRKEDYYDERE